MKQQLKVISSKKHIDLLPFLFYLFNPNLTNFQVATALAINIMSLSATLGVLAQGLQNLGAFIQNCFNLKTRWFHGDLTDHRSGQV